ncbi:MAG TPA: NUDIX hydrolase [Verrucomicrobiae bacterium]|nr:NUDIX hydrolase [Verrucomicrobiae bacterium]
MTCGQPQPWQIQSSETLADCRIFKVRKDLAVNPRTGQPHEMFVLEQPNWVNVIPLTPDEQVVMVKQWRHGTRSVHLETPGGLMDDGETPEQCARRELLEETGYDMGSIVRLGTVHPNPAIQNNRQYYILAKDCHRVSDPKLDLAEDIAVKLVPLADIPQMIETGEITHGIVIGGFYWLDLYRQQHG